ncbi:META domain-containing protein [Streptomyces sp. NPDC001415]
MGKPSRTPRRKLSIATAVLAGLLAVAACGDVHAIAPVATASRAPDVPLTTTRWTVNGLLDTGVSQRVPDGTAGKAYLIFGEDGRVQGKAGCNTIRGAATVSASAHTITFGPLGSTRMLCTGPEMRLERAVLDVLKGKVGYRLDHRGLILTATPGGKGLSAGVG